MNFFAKLGAIALCFGIAAGLNEMEYRTRGKGSWAKDRLLIRLQGACFGVAAMILIA